MATTTTNNGWTIPQSTDLVSAGATAIATLGNGIDTSTGKGLLAWQSYTPTWTNLTIGNGTNASAYCQIGKTVHFRIKLTFGSTTTVSGNIIASLPVTASTNFTSNQPFGWCNILDFSAPTLYSAYAYQNSTTTAFIAVQVATGTYTTYSGTSATIPMTWAVNDTIQITGTYEAA